MNERKHSVEDSLTATSLFNLQLLQPYSFQNNVSALEKVMNNEKNITHPMEFRNSSTFLYVRPS